ncbi:hypothetical protein ACWD3K_27295, partial [Streptomyces sp. NPDC002778]
GLTAQTSSGVGGQPLYRFSRLRGVTAGERSTPMTFGADAGSAVDFLFAMGPTRYNLREVNPETVSRIRAEVHDALAEFETSDGVRIPGSVWIVTASRGHAQERV